GRAGHGEEAGDLFLAPEVGGVGDLGGAARPGAPAGPVAGRGGVIVECGVQCVGPVADAVSGVGAGTSQPGFPEAVTGGGLWAGGGLGSGLKPPTGVLGPSVAGFGGRVGRDVPFGPAGDAVEDRGEPRAVRVAELGEAGAVAVEGGDPHGCGGCGAGGAVDHVVVGLGGGLRPGPVGGAGAQGRFAVLVGLDGADECGEVAGDDAADGCARDPGRAVECGGSEVAGHAVQVYGGAAVAGRGPGGRAGGGAGRVAGAVAHRSQFLSTRPRG